MPLDVNEAAGRGLVSVFPGEAVRKLCRAGLDRKTAQGLIDKGMEGIAKAAIALGANPDALARLPDATASEPDCTVRAYTVDELLAPIPPTRYLIDGLIPCEAYTILAGALGSGKTTFGLSVQIWRATGFDILNLDPDGRKCVDPGPAVFITYEDSDKVISGRFLRIVQWAHAGILATHGAKAARTFLNLLARHFRRITLTGQPGAQLIVRDIHGQPRRNEAQLETLISTIGEFADSEVLIMIDPLRLAFTGSQNDDYGADLGVHTLNALACEFPDSGLAALSHATKQHASDQPDDRVALAYGTSGSALWSQHARSNFHAGRPKVEELRRIAATVLSEEEIQKRHVTAITHARLSYGAEADTAYYAMRGGVLVPLPIVEAESVMTRLRRLMPIVAAAVERIGLEGGRPSQTALESDPSVRKHCSRDTTRELIRECIAQGWLTREGKTKDAQLVLTETGRQFAPKTPA